MTYKIEDGFPVPALRKKRADKENPFSCYRLHELEVGQSVLISNRSRSAITSAIAHFLWRKPNKDFNTKSQTKA